jgi:hypothetical protein
MLPNISKYVRSEDNKKLIFISQKYISSDKIESRLNLGLLCVKKTHGVSQYLKLLRKSYVPFYFKENKICNDVSGRFSKAVPGYNLLLVKALLFVLG